MRGGHAPTRMTAPRDYAGSGYFLRVVEREVEPLPVLLDVDLLVDAFEVVAFEVDALAVDALAVLFGAALLVEDLAVEPLAVEAFVVDAFVVDALVVEALLVLFGAALLAEERLVDVFAVEPLAVEAPRPEVVRAVLRGDVVVDAERLVERDDVFGAALLDEVRVEVLRVAVRLAVPGLEDVVDLPVVFDDVLAVVLLDEVRAAEAFVLCFGSFFEPLTTSLKWVPARKAGTLVFLTRTASPVRGLRAVRAARARFSKTPKPVIVTFSPLLTVRTMMSTRLSTASDAVFLSPRRSPSASISSALLAIGSPP